jgi:hypothetical protein
MDFAGEVLAGKKFFQNPVAICREQSIIFRRFFLSGNA